jgi:Ca2+:H+ antiporter
VVPYLRSDRVPGTSERAADPSGGAAVESSSVDAAESPADAEGVGSPDAPTAESRPSGPRLSLGLTLALLIVAGTASAFVSDWFVNGLEPAISILHISQAFAGLVIVAIAGNAVENTAGLVLAYKRRSDLAISVVKNSVAQIAAFLFPALVLVSFALKTTLTFALAPVYIGALALTALALWQVTGDGEAAEFEGWALVALYVILATLTLYE